MRETVTPGAAPLGEKRPPIFFHYLQRALANRGKGDPRAKRELTTLALAVDRILEGRQEESLDILAQRFSPWRVPSSSRGSSSARPSVTARAAASQQHQPSSQPRRVCTPKEIYLLYLSALTPRSCAGCKCWSRAAYWAASRKESGVKPGPDAGGALW